MKINTLLAICLFAFSPLAMAGHGSSECSKGHQMAMAEHGDHVMPAAKLDVNAKTCKDHCGDMHKEHAKQQAMPLSHSGMNHAEHMKAMGDTCPDADCAKMCDSEDAQCDDVKCEDHCASMHEEHVGH